MADNQTRKDKKWLFFAIGLIVGFLISAVAFVVFAMIQSHTGSIIKPIEYIYHRDNDKDTVVKYVNVVRQEMVTNSKDEQSESQDTVAVEESPVDFDEVDFSYAETANAQGQDVVMEEKIIAQKKLQVKFKSTDFKDVDAEDGALTELEVQQWNTPIKNRITYRFVDNMLQVKGIDIDKLDIIHYDQHYYLSYHGSYYLLENNSGFERLGVAHAMPAQR